MKAEESMNEFDERVINIINELNALGKVYSNKEIALKVMRGLVKEWDIKTMAMRESKDLHKVELHDLFADLKTYEFELQTREDEQPVPPVTNALSAMKLEPTTSVEKSAEQLSCEMELLSFEHGNLHICRISLIQAAGNQGSKWSHLRLSSLHRTTSQICAVDISAFSYGASMRNKICRFVLWSVPR